MDALEQRCLKVLGVFANLTADEDLRRMLVGATEAQMILSTHKDHECFASFDIDVFARPGMLRRYRMHVRRQQDVDVNIYPGADEALCGVLIPFDMSANLLRAYGSRFDGGLLWTLTDLMPPLAKMTKPCGMSDIDAVRMLHDMLMGLGTLITLRITHKHITASSVGVDGILGTGAVSFRLGSGSDRERHVAPEDEMDITADILAVFNLAASVFVHADTWDRIHETVDGFVSDDWLPVTMRQFLHQIARGVQTCGQIAQRIARTEALWNDGCWFSADKQDMMPIIKTMRI